MKRGYLYPPDVERLTFVGWCGFRVEGDSAAHEVEKHLEACRKCAYEQRQPPGMRGFVDLGSDVRWEEHGGKWGRRAPDGSWLAILADVADYDPPIRNKNSGRFPYDCAVVRVDVPSFKSREGRARLYSILKTIGYEGEWPPHDQTIVEAAIASGVYDSLETFRTRMPGESALPAETPAHVRAKAKRYVAQHLR